MDIMEHLESAESEVMNSIEELSRSKDRDYDKMRKYLQLAEEINEVKKKASHLISGYSTGIELGSDSVRLSLQKADSSKKNFLKKISKEDSFLGKKNNLPCYFVWGPYLVKIGESGEGEGLYRKKVPIRSVEESLDILSFYAQKKEPFTMSDAISHIQGPSYRMQITLSALIELKQFKNIGRGIYIYCGDENSWHSWMDKLKSLPVRRDLLEKSNN